VSTKPVKWPKKAINASILGPRELYSRPPNTVAIGNPKKAIELIQPNSVSLKPKSPLSWLKMPARIEKVIDVTVSAIQQAINIFESETSVSPMVSSLLTYRFLFIDRVSFG